MGSGAFVSHGGDAEGEHGPWAQGRCAVGFVTQGKVVDRRILSPGESQSNLPCRKQRQMLRPRQCLKARGI